MNISPIALTVHQGKLISKLSPSIQVSSELGVFDSYRFRIVLVEGEQFAFYQSSGLSSGHQGDWFPAGELSMGSNDGDDPISKLTGQHIKRKSQMNYHYGHPIMAAIAEELKEIDKQQHDENLVIPVSIFNAYLRETCYDKTVRGKYDDLFPKLKSLSAKWAERNNQGSEIYDFNTTFQVLEHFTQVIQFHLGSERLGDDSSGWYFPSKDQVLEDVQALTKYMKAAHKPPSAIEIAATRRAILNFEHCIHTYLTKKDGKNKREKHNLFYPIQQSLHEQSDSLDSAFRKKSTSTPVSQENDSLASFRSSPLGATPEGTSPIQDRLTKDFEEKGLSNKNRLEQYKQLIAPMLHNMVNILLDMKCPAVAEIFFKEDHKYINGEVNLDVFIKNLKNSIVQANNSLASELCDEFFNNLDNMVARPEPPGEQIGIKNNRAITDSLRSLKRQEDGDGEHPSPKPKI